MSATMTSLRASRRALIFVSVSAIFGLGSPSIPAATVTVQNCGDGGAGSGSLRDIVTHVAQSGDTVDLSQLPMTCNMANSTITLTNGEIVISQDDLTLQGPAVGLGTVAISGNHASRVFHHAGNQTLSVAELTIKDGVYNSQQYAYGGCVYSTGSVFLSHSTVTGCSVLGESYAGGGGVYTHADLTLLNSTLSGNVADSTSASAYGGGAYVHGALTSKYSTIDSNIAHSPNGAGSGSNGGGLSVRSNALILNSTISRNKASNMGAVASSGETLTIRNSTVATNVATNVISAIWNSGPVIISNSTVAFNQALSGDTAALVVTGVGTLSLESSIVANNTDGTGAADIRMFGTGSISFANNLVIASNFPLPAGTLTSDPKLGPLAFNGGPTQTLSLLTDSPAIGAGNNPENYSFDQRGHYYPRMSGPSASVDIGALQFDSVFVGNFEL